MFDVAIVIEDQVSEWNSVYSVILYSFPRGDRRESVGNGLWMSV